MLTREMLMRFNVVAAYYRYDSVVPEPLIQPDHRTKQMMEKESKVSMARKGLGLPKIRPAWRWCSTLPDDSRLRGETILLLGSESGKMTAPRRYGSSRR